MQGNPEVSKGSVNQILDEMGIGHSLAGYTYLMDAITMICSNPKMHEDRRIMDVYGEIAKQRRIGWSRVESGIRAALKKARIKKTNGQFIFWAADHLRFYQAPPVCGEGVGGDW
jgi:hypothetical protein